MVIGYKVGKSNRTQLVKNTFKIVYERRKPGHTLIFHTDRAKAFCGYLSFLHVAQLFSRAHVPYDNSVIETFFSSMKREE